MTDVSSDGVGQSALFPEQTIAETDEVPGSVWVVASRKEDSPHPYVEAVYDNEEAAEEHKQELARNSFQHGVVAWDVFEREVQRDTAGEEVTRRD